MSRSRRKAQTSRSPTEIDRAVGVNIRKLRTERNLTLAELGDALGISHQQLQKYETGTNRLSAGMLAKVSDVLGGSIPEFFEQETDAGSGKMSALEQARKDCLVWVNRTKSLAKLEEMAKVLKALSA
nr:helix-turn-helix transcriptional regulator [uncultured Hyphomonas sp.]